ncbi:MAG: polysaccharide biosynthesis protein [Gemmatimonadetes bacterium]|nr:polysaccharide biosynthesis protein [Gemmatimonadota bacterium]
MSNLLGSPAGLRSMAGSSAALELGSELHPLLLRYRRAILVALHLLLVPLAYRLAFELRFDFAIPGKVLRAFWLTLPLLILVRLGTFAVFRVYRGWWRHVGMYDLVELVKALAVGSGLFVAGLYLTGEIRLLPRSILVLEWGIALLCFGGIRFGVRWLREGRAMAVGSRAGKRTLIVGAGPTAASLIRQVRLEPESGIYPVGLVDDDPASQRLRIHSVPVLGTTADLRRIIAMHRIRLVVAATPSATREEMQRIASKCADLDVELKVVPSICELLDGTAKLSQLRAVPVEELLGRRPISLELSRVKEDLGGKVVLVTGGAGSIGSELARQVAEFGPERLILLEQAESPLYYTNLDLRKAHPELQIVPVIADVTDPDRLERIFAEHRPDYVFHAAAYKHVPMMEANPSEAIRNNVFGTLNVAECARRHGVEKMVLISTDKAVHPSSVMGATKRVAERLILGLPEFVNSRTEFRAVRFGNVLGSDGSVVPLFKRQIAAGGPVTVTDPDVTRYFMTIPEAVQLVLEAAALPEAGRRIAMLDMGKPVRILELAENLIRLSGLEPYTQMPIVFTGLRPGEKLHEELMSELESTVPTAVEKIRIVCVGEEVGALLRLGLEQLGRALASGSNDAQLAALCALVPECVPPLRTAGEEAARRIAAGTPIASAGSRRYRVAADGA